MSQYLEPLNPKVDYTPRKRTNSSSSTSSAFSDWDVFETMVRKEKNPAPIVFPDLDELFQLHLPNPPPSRIASCSSISGMSDLLKSSNLTSGSPAQINGQNPPPGIFSQSRNPSISGSSQIFHSPVNIINSPVFTVFNDPRPTALPGNSSLPVKFQNSLRVSSPGRVLNGQTPYHVPSGLSRSSSMPGDFQVSGVNPNLINSPAMTAVHGQSPRPSPSPLSRTSSTPGTLEFLNSTPDDYYTNPVIFNGQFPQPAVLTANSPSTNSPAPTFQQPSRRAPTPLSRSLTLPGNSQVFNSPRISGQSTRLRPSTLSRSYTVTGNMQFPNATPINSPTFLNNQIPQSHSAVSRDLGDSAAFNILRISGDNKPKPTLKRARTMSFSSDPYGENVNPDIAHVRKKQAINKSDSRTGAYIKTQPLPSGTYEEIVPAPFDTKWFPDAEVEDITETYKIKFEYIRSGNNPDRMSTPLGDCILGMGLKNPHEHVFNNWLNDGNLEVNLVISWPGYPYFTLPVSPLFGRNGEAVTREYLARVIGCCYQNFLLACTSSAEGSLACQDPRWRIGNGGYTLDRLRLVSMERVIGSYWQASMTVLTDRVFNPKPQFMRDLFTN